MRKWLLFGLGVGLGFGVCRVLAVREEGPIATASTAPPQQGSRYPEENIVDALRAAEGAEMADLYDAVSGRRGNGSGER